MTHVTCRLTAKNRDQLRNPTLRNRAWAAFTFYLLSDAGSVRLSASPRPLAQRTVHLKAIVTTELIGNSMLKVESTAWSATQSVSRHNTKPAPTMASLSFRPRRTIFSVKFARGRQRCACACAVFRSIR